MEKIKQLLLYCGLTRESYKNVEPQVREENRRSMVVFAMFAVVGFSTGLLMRFVGDFGMKRLSICVLIALFLMMAILASTAAKRNPRFSDALVYVFTILLLGGGVYAGVSQRGERTTLLLAFYVFSAVLFCERLIHFLIIIFSTEILYLILIFQTQETKLILVNAVNTTIFCAIGALVAVYIMRMKYKNHENDYINKFLIERDSLTGLYNRRSYENELERVKREGIAVAICAFDVNGLKTTNDTKGHKAGDELIIGAARCISSAFGKYGKVFRTGGDEYMAVLDKQFGGRDQLLQEFAEITAQWKGEMVEEMNISAGIELWSSNMNVTLEEVATKADMAMYEEKRKYYAAKGMTK